MSRGETLVGLDEEEERLVRALRHDRGPSADSDGQRMHMAYRHVHRSYVELAEGGDIEALKRAIFLQWFSNVEPPFLTGLAELDPVPSARAMVLLEAQCATDALDDELKWMLPYYFSFADWAFPGAERAPRLTAFCTASTGTHVARPPPRAEFLGRGQMGEYWRQIADVSEPAKR